jgi:hypothetical protein
MADEVMGTWAIARLLLGSVTPDKPKANVILNTENWQIERMANSGKISVDGKISVLEFQENTDGSIDLIQLLKNFNKLLYTEDSTMSIVSRTF